MNDDFSLLPPHVASRNFLSSATRTWAIIWGFVVLGTFGYCAIQRDHMDQQQATVDRLAEQAEPLTKLRSEVRRMKAEIKKINEREAWMTEADSNCTLQLIGIISQAGQANNGRINVQDLVLERVEEQIGEPEKSKSKRKTSTAKKPQLRQRTTLNLTGYAVDDLAVASFVSMLREARVFESVELKSSLSQVFQGHETRQYQVACVY